MFLTKEPLTIKGGRRSRGGGLMSSSLPNHDAKDQRIDRKEIEGEKKKKKNKGRLQVSIKI